MSVSLSGGVSGSIGGATVSVAGIATVSVPAIPFVLPFPGVPQLSGSVQASLGIQAPLVQGLGAVSAGVNIGPGGISGGISGNLGPLSGGLSVNPDGTVSASGNLSLGPFSLSLNASLPPLLTQDEPGGLFTGPTWGVFDSNGQQVADWDSVLRVDYRRDYRVADFPIEDGQFRSYNKVQMPFDARISFVVGSGLGTQKRTAMLDALEAAVASLDFYTVSTPEKIYVRANLTHIEYSREARRGVNLLVCDIWLREIRPADPTVFTDSPNPPSAKSPANNGQSQAQDIPWTVPSQGGGPPDRTVSPQQIATGAGPSTNPENDMPALGSGAGSPPSPPPYVPAASAPTTANAATETVPSNPTGKPYAGMQIPAGAIF